MSASVQTVIDRVELKSGDGAAFASPDAGGAGLPPPEAAPPVSPQGAPLRRRTRKRGVWRTEARRLWLVENYATCSPPSRMLLALNALPGDPYTRLDDIYAWAVALHLRRSPEAAFRNRRANMLVNSAAREAAIAARTAAKAASRAANSAPAHIPPPARPAPLVTRDGAPSVAALLEDVANLEYALVSIDVVQEWGRRHIPPPSLAEVNARRAALGLPLFKLIPRRGPIDPLPAAHIGGNTE